MEGLSITVLGFLIGMQHALETDHLAAIATLFADDSNRGKLVKRGIIWGLGHTIALILMCSLVLLINFEITAKVEAGVELFVGLMVLFLGLHLCLTLRSRGLHLHGHKHDHGVHHLHIHNHENSESHNHNGHHALPQLPSLSLDKSLHKVGTNLLKPLGIGLVHGIAGSGALLLVLAATVNSMLAAFVYVALFGLGSLCGMAALSFVVSYPLNILGKKPEKIFRGVMFSISAVAMFVGGHLVLVNWELLIQL